MQDECHRPPRRGMYVLKLTLEGGKTVKIPVQGNHQGFVRTYVRMKLEDWL